MPKLLKTPMRGGIVTLTDRELVLGEGPIGARHMRRFPLQSLAHLDLRPSPGDAVQGRNALLHFVWADGETTDVDGVGPLAAQRMRAILHALMRKP